MCHLYMVQGYNGVCAIYDKRWCAESKVIHFILHVITLGLITKITFSQIFCHTLGLFINQVI